MKKLFELKGMQDLTEEELFHLKTMRDEKDTFSIWKKYRKAGFLPKQILLKIIDQLWKSDWSELWDDFEEDGRMTIFDFQIRGVQFWFEDYNGEFFYNDNPFYQYEENDKFDATLTKKLKEKVKKHVSENANTYEFLISSMYETTR